MNARSGWIALAGAGAVAAFAVKTAAATGAARSMSLREAVDYALAHDPRLAEADAVRGITQAKADAARAGMLPEASLDAQLNRATGNVVPGSLFSMRGIPAVSGPPRGRTFDSGVWGTSVGVSASWDVLLLKRQMAVVDTAIAEQGRAEAAMSASRLEAAFDTADRFITSVSRGEVVHAAQAGVERGRVFLEIVKALVDQQLRPGVDLSRSQAELAIAEAQLIRTQQNEAVTRIDLARSMGDPRLVVLPAPGPLTGSLPAASSSGTGRPHPALVEAGAAVSAAQKRQEAVGVEYLPRLELVGALWARGSGYFPKSDGSPPPGHGLVPDTPNWAAGVNFTWPILEIVGTRARARAESANVRLASARQEQISQLIDAQLLSAATIVDAAQKVAAQTPVAVNAARAAETQATARYRSGLATVLEVAEAERLLTDAEIQDAEARLGVWSALLLASRAAGDLGPFLAAASTGGH
jgi:outer membrane protein TolC